MNKQYGSLPYSQKRLEDLAAALGIDSALLWINPTNNALDIREMRGRVGSDGALDELEEVEEE